MSRKKQLPSPTPELAVGTTAKISLDLGNAYSNIRADGGIIADLRSVIGRIGNANQMKSLPADSAITIGGVGYVFGEAAYTFAANTLEDFPTKDRYTSDWYKRLFAFGLFKAYGMRLSEGVFYPHVVSSVPASEYKIKSRVEQIKARLVGSYEIETTQNTCLHVVIDPKNLTIIPEGSGTYFKFAEPGSKYERGVWVVLDLGYLTGDIVIFRDGEYMAEKSTSNDTIGVHKIAEAVAEFVYASGGPDQPPHAYDKVLMCDVIPVSGADYSIKEIRDTTIVEVAERINRFLQQATSGLNIAGVLVGGGGADRYFDHIHVKGIKEKATDPRRSNVDGGYIMLEQQG